MLYRTAVTSYYIYLSGGAFRGCTCLKCTNKAVKCTNIPSVVNISCLDGALETSAPPEESVEE